MAKKSSYSDEIKWKAIEMKLVTRDGIWMDIQPRGSLVGDKLQDLKVTTFSLEEDSFFKPEHVDWALRSMESFYFY